MAVSARALASSPDRNGAGPKFSLRRLNQSGDAEVASLRYSLKELRSILGFCFFLRPFFFFLNRGYFKRPLATLGLLLAQMEGFHQPADPVQDQESDVAAH